MQAGTRVYRAYIGTNPLTNWIDEGEVSEVSANGSALVKVRYGSYETLDDRWHATRAGAYRDIHTALIRRIGELQAVADELADQILHADLTTEAA